MMKNKNHYSSVIIGGGAAGFFAAIKCAESRPQRGVLLLEKTLKLLTKVKVSGGGRCNVTHFCFDPSELVKNYPRGNKELKGPFSRFQPRDTIEWFNKKGVQIKRESDGRMFPVTDDSQTIIDCLVKAAKDIDIQCGKTVSCIDKKGNEFRIKLKDGDELSSDTVMLATGGSQAGHALAKEFGHSIVEPISSLFTFNIPTSPLHSLSGISVENAVVSLPEFRSKQSGPLLITHWGFSGPAVLKLSAFCARYLYNSSYKTVCQIDWIPEFSDDQMREMINNKKQSQNKKNVLIDPLFKLPKQLWKSLVATAGADEDMRWGKISKSQIEKIIQKLKRDRYDISGKTTYKQEFVTCGGVKLSEVDFQTMESKIVPGLFFGGEILDIDGITGGFNFQAAWTTGWLAGKAMAERISEN